MSLTVNYGVVRWSSLSRSSISYSSMGESNAILHTVLCLFKTISKRLSLGKAEQWKGCLQAFTQPLVPDRGRNNHWQQVLGRMKVYLCKGKHFVGDSYLECKYYKVYIEKTIYNNVFIYAQICSNALDGHRVIRLTFSTN